MVQGLSLARVTSRPSTDVVTCDHVVNGGLQKAPAGTASYYRLRVRPCHWCLSSPANNNARSYAMSLTGVDRGVAERAGSWSWRAAPARERR
jgi:hypothetical protein